MSLRYDAQKDTLYAASALDPQFKALPSLSAKERDDTVFRPQTEAANAARDASVYKKYLISMLLIDRLNILLMD